MCSTVIIQYAFDTDVPSAAIEKCTFYTNTATNSTSVFHKWNWIKCNTSKFNRRQSRELAL